MKANRAGRKRSRENRRSSTLEAKLLAMSAATLLLAALAAVPVLGSGIARAQALTYSADSIVNAADFRPRYLAPNALATVYGENLAFRTRAVAPADLVAGCLPLTLGGVRVVLAGLIVNLLYVSPTQINFLIPNDLLPGDHDFYVDREGMAGPRIRIHVSAAAPAAFQMDERTIIATHADGSVVTDEAPAHAEEIVVLWATGLARTSPEQRSGWLAVGLGPAITPLSIYVNGELLEPERTLYAGAAPGFAGLYRSTSASPRGWGTGPRLNSR